MINPKKAVRLYAKGLSLREVALELGCNVTTIRDAVKPSGLLRSVGDREGKAWRNRRARRSA